MRRKGAENSVFLVIFFLGFSFNIIVLLLLCTQSNPSRKESFISRTGMEVRFYASQKKVLICYNELKILFILQVLHRKKIVPSESCLENEEYELIRQSCAWEINKRLKISQVSERLQEMSRRAKKSGMCHFKLMVTSPSGFEVDLKRTKKMNDN